LAIAITREIVDQYQRVAAKAGLKLIGFEPEVFPLARAILRGDKTVACLMDVGTKSTTVSIVENGLIKDSHSLSFSASSFNAKASKDLNLEVSQIEALKEEQGVAENSRLLQSTQPLLNIFASEVIRLTKDYQRLTGKSVQKMLLSGGMSQMPGFKEFAIKNFPAELGVDYAYAFSGVKYPKSLEDILKKLSPQFSIAVGLAMKAAEI
jgi:Tfp pilus assembly PilM family ATPase